ncbi:MAG: MYXO-CTERM sorting domain-containing protein [Deltaproteobacteria bacterium]|nr:MYXO-CTERM sorting domain-containing protein [Deltaproteobacteria bacterium]
MTLTFLNRKRALVSLFILSLSTAGAAESMAQDCLSDDDCPEDEHCDLPPVSTICRNSSEPGEEPVCTTEEQSPGRCEPGPGACRKDEDCGEGYVCEKEDSTVALPACDPEGSCPELEVEEVDEEGWCEPAPLECEIDNDCPSPLVCERQGEDANYCSYKLIECSDDADCEKGYECASAGSSETCTSVQELPSSAPGLEGEESDAGSPPEPVENECETVVQKICFPKRKDCQSDSDCSDGWKCLDFSDTYLLREDYEDGEYAGPPWWQEGDETKAVACMPEGWFAIFQGRVHMEGESDEESSDNLSAYEAQNALKDRNEADDDEQSTDEIGACGCSVTSKPSGHAYFLALAALILALRRRRRL